MKRPIIAVSLLSLLAGAGLAAADPPADPPTRSGVGQALPPPHIDDPGVASAAAAATEQQADPLQPAMPDTRAVRDRASRADKQAQAEAIRKRSDNVTRRQEGDDTVEEYREHGQVRMIRIIPRTGPEQIYMDTSGDGRLERDPRDGPVAPVYFTLYQWK